MVRIDARIKEISQVRSRSRGKDEATLRKEIEVEIAALKAERKELEAAIPANWKDARKKFVDIQKADVNGRRLYRRTVDSAYEPVREAVKVLSASDEFAKLEAPIKSLGVAIETKSPAEAAELVNEVAQQVGKVDGARAVRSALNNVRRALKRRTPEIDKAKEDYAKALDVYADELKWRTAAKTTVLPKLAAYEEAIRHTIGLRQQERLPREQALFVAGCTSGHRDISLSF
jgi:hypothetical protein